ncbi:microtubule-associated protein futsch isoform X2 [Drosophila montana]|uniref:microtubule-associated protein futsch isoform X2 n=1 Tax=Drosophila montana TaxID=40370 RepID=UPI00313D8A84
MEKNSPEEGVEQIAPRRSMRRLSVEQSAVGLTTRRSVRRASMEASNKLEQCSKPTRRASCTASLENQVNVIAPATPKRKRRLTEELSTPTRKSLRLLIHTPKPAAEVDESVGDMGVIVEEEDALQIEANKLPADEDYGNELTADANEPDKIDYHGMRELLKTPKSCSTPRFKGLREMMRTPKVPKSPILGNIDELLEADSNDATGTPKRQLTVNRVTLELTHSEAPGDAQDLYFKTPRGKNLMIPNEPASAVLKTCENSLATTTEYDLNATNTTLHLDKIFDDVLTAEATNPVITVEDSEAEINVTAVSVANTSAPDPLSTTVARDESVEPSDTMNSEALMTIANIDGSNRDPLTSTAFKPGAGGDLHTSALSNERYSDIAKSTEICEVSGIQLLDQTSDSMFSEQLIVSGVASCDVTLEETKATGLVKLRTPRKERLEEGSDTDSMVGLTEPLVLSDDEDEVEVVPDGNEQLEKPNANKSVVQVEETHLEQEHSHHVSIKEPEQDRYDFDIAENSSVKEQESIENKSAILDNSQKNGQETEVSIVEELSVQLETSTQTVFQIDLEATNIDETLAQIDIKRKSTIYTINVSQDEVNTSLEESLDNNLSKVQDESIIELNASSAAEESLSKDINKAPDVCKDESIIELDASNAATSSVGEWNKSTVNDKNKDFQFNKSQDLEQLADELEAVDEPVEEWSIEEVLECELSSKEKGEIQKEQSPELKSNVSKESLEHDLAKDTNEAEIPGTLEATNEQESILEEFIESKETSISSTSASRETADVQAEEITKTPADEEAIVQNVTITVDLEESVIELDASVLEDADILIEQLEEQIPEIVITSPSEILDLSEAGVEAIQLNELLMEISASTVAQTECKGEATSIEAEPEMEMNASAGKSVVQEDIQESMPGSAEELLNQLNPTAESESDNAESEESAAQAILESSTTNENESIVQLDDENENKFTASFGDILPRSSEESSADTNEAPANVEASLIEPDASVAVKGDKNEQNVNEQASETSEKSIGDKDKNTTQGDEEVTNVDESVIELNASVVAEADNTLDEHKEQAPAPSEVTNVDESLIEPNTSVVGEADNVDKQLGAEAPEMMESSSERASIEATDAHEMHVTDEAMHESAIELDASVVTTTEIPISSKDKASVDEEAKRKDNCSFKSNAETEGQESLEISINEKQTEEENTTNGKQDEPIEEIPPFIESSAQSQDIKEAVNTVLDASTANQSDLEEPIEISQDIKSDHEKVVDVIDTDAACKAGDDFIEENENLLAKSSPVPESSVQAEESTTNLDYTADNVAEKDIEESKSSPVAESIELQVEASNDTLNESASSVAKMDENVTAEAAPDEQLGVQGESNQVLDQIEAASADQSELNVVAENDQKKPTIDEEESSEESEKVEAAINLDASCAAENDPESVADNSIEESADQSELNVVAENDQKKPTIPEEESSEEPEKVEAVTDLDASCAADIDSESVADNPIEESADQSELNVVAENDQKKTKIAEEEFSEEPEEVEAAIDLDASCGAEKDFEYVADNPIEESADQSELNVVAENDQERPTIDEEESSDESEKVEAAIDLDASCAAENDSESVADDPIEDSLAMDTEEQSRDLLTGVEEFLAEEEELAGQEDKGVGKMADQPNAAQETETNQSEGAEDIIPMEEINLSSSQVESLDKDDEDEVEKTEKMPAEVSPVESEAVIDLDDSTVDSSSVAATVIELDDSTTADSSSDATVIAPFDEAVIELNDSSTDTNSVLDKQSEDTKAEPLESPPMQVAIELPEDSSSISNIENADAEANVTTTDNLNQVTVGDGYERQAVSEQVQIEAVATEAQKVNEAENLENKMEEEPKKVRRGRRPSILVEPEAEPYEPKSSKRGNRNATPTVKAENSKLSRRLSTDVFAESQDQETIEKAEVQQKVDVVENIARVTNVKKAPEADDKTMEKPKRLRRKSTAELAENVKQVSAEATDQEKPKRRGKKHAAEIVDAQVEGKTDDRTKRCGRKSALETDESQESVEKQEAEKIAEGVEISTENKFDETSDLTKAKRRGRRSTVDVEVEKNVKDTIAEIHKPKRRGRKPTVDTEAVEREVEETIAVGIVTHGEIVAEASDLTKTKRRGRKATVEAVETESPAEKKVEEAIEAESQTSEEANSLPKTKRRGRKATVEVNETKQQAEKLKEAIVDKTMDLDKPRTRRGRKPTTEIEPSEAPAQGKLVEGTNDETHTQVEKEEESTDTDKPKRRGRKHSADVEAEAPEVVASVKPIEEPIKEKPKRRGRKASSAEVAETTETAQLPERKPARTARKASAETVEQQAASKEHLAIIEEAAEPAAKSMRLEDPAVAETSSTVKKRGRRPSVSAESVQPASPAQELVVASGSREKSATRRGRKATADTDAPAETAELKQKRRGRKASDDGMHSTDETSQEPAEKQARRGRKPSADVEHKAAAEAEPPVEKKPTKRRGRKPSVHIETSVEKPPPPTPQAKKATARRGRKASLSATVDELEQQLDVQNLHAQLPEPAIVVVAASPKPQLPSSEDELTPRRREGRNLPRKNYDETSDEDKLGSSSRRARKPAAGKTAATTAAKSPGAGTSPIPKPNTPLPTKQKATAEPTVEPVEPVAPHTPTGQTIVLPDQTSSQRREGRNVPRKNYNETSDDEKPATSRGRRVRQPTAKALELLVDAAVQRPATPKRRKGKAAAEHEAEAEQPPEKKVAADEATPVVTKPRGGARRKAPEMDGGADIVAAAAKRVARNRKESATSQHEEADVEDAAEPKQTPAKRNARKAKAAEAQPEAEQPATKKARGGARAKTPVVVADPNDVEMDSTEVPATKRAPAARGRAARTTKPVQEVENESETPAPIRAGRGRKVHFETTEETTTSTASAAQPGQSEAPKRATRSRRK